MDLYGCSLAVHEFACVFHYVGFIVGYQGCTFSTFLFQLPLVAVFRDVVLIHVVSKYVVNINHITNRYYGLIQNKVPEILKFNEFSCF